MFLCFSPPQVNQTIQFRQGQCLKTIAFGVVFADILPETFILAFLHLLPNEKVKRGGKVQAKNENALYRNSSLAVVQVSSPYAPMQFDPVEQLFSDLAWSTGQGKRAQFVFDGLSCLEMKWKFVLYSFTINANELISRWCQYRTYRREPPPIWDALWDRKSIITVMLQFSASLLCSNTASPVRTALIRLQAL